MDLKSRLDYAVKAHKNVLANIERTEMIREAVDNREAIIAESGALATWTPIESTGRSPKDTVIVKRPISEKNIDWTSPNNIPIDEETFDMIFEDALEYMARKDKMYMTDRIVGADSAYALPVKVVSSHALHVLFTDNMFRPVPTDIENSVFNNKDFYLLQLPYNKLDASKYNGRLRTLPNGN
ncbi:MAG: phosphoenolpyruvate carboxykinase (ATP), partial [Bacteroidota bacterium]|nr:phosphoenolpyruvate carboxykinase (ATP) [Bacteroidota bacterium]